MKSVLIIDDEVGARESLKMAFKDDYEILLARNGEEALGQFNKYSPDIILLDIILPDIDGLKVLERIRQENKQIPVIMITATQTVKTAVQAMKLGASEYFTKPFDVEELRLKVSHAISDQASQAELNHIRRRENIPFGQMIGNSQSMKEVSSLIEQVAPSNATVLVMGETGTGKELVSRAIHRQSPRKNFPFVTINCAAIPEALIESELFGHEKGAFTNAHERKLGHCEVADQGTLFLDEIGELNLVTQAKILRFLEQKEFNRIGNSRTIKVDVRLIAATNKDLTQQIKKGEFREDLYYRVNVVPILVPPLRERKEDIPLLAEHFVKKYGGARSRVKGISPDGLEWMLGYEWPGNVRELEHLIERAIALTRKEYIESKDLLFPSSNDGVQTDRITESAVSYSTNNVSLAEDVERLERERIADALKRANYVQSHAAELLGISRRILKYKMDKLGIEQAGQ